MLSGCGNPRRDSEVVAKTIKSGSIGWFDRHSEECHLGCGGDRCETGSLPSSPRVLISEPTVGGTKRTPESEVEQGVGVVAVCLLRGEEVIRVDKLTTDPLVGGSNPVVTRPLPVISRRETERSSGGTGASVCTQTDRNPFPS